MRATNLYVLTRLSEIELYPLYEKCLSQRAESIKVRCEEIELIKIMINNLRFRDKNYELLDDWFYSFSIPQIGKEFDLLKINEDGKIINVELKSQAIDEARIEFQLQQNRYYLSHIGKEIYSFSLIKENDKSVKIYKYDDGLKECSYEELLDKLRKINKPINQNIENLFRPKEYLISPLNTPEKFLAGHYYLSGQQDSIKKEFLRKKDGLWGIKGAAGTGKTLLLYDIAKELSTDNQVCVVHCGVLSDGHKHLNSKLSNVSVISAKSVTKDIIDKYPIVCVDETQRLYKSSLDLILEAYSEGKIQTCIFSYDFAQSLSKTEVRRNNPGRLNELKDFIEFKLTDKIRTNKEIHSFIRNMMRLADKAKGNISYDNIDIVFAKDLRESDIISNFYIEKGYTFITFTPSQYVSNPIDHYSQYINSHQVIGQEFDSVLVILDSSFRYNADGVLQAKEHPNPDYLFPRLFYQNISRAREKLCIIVRDNVELFETLLRVKDRSI